MATYYLDPWAGNDANDGTTFANRWKTYTSGATAARIAPGDTIRCISTPADSALGTCGWTNGSKVITIPTGTCKTLSTCETVWTAVTGVTCSSNSGARRQGTNSLNVQITNNTLTGKLAYFDLGAATDFSAYQIVSLMRRTNNATTGVLEIRLCSDATGDTAITTLTLLTMVSSNRWHADVMDSGAALPSNVRSVALYRSSGTGTPTLIIDNIVACKAYGTADCLTHLSVIKKSGSTDPWRPLMYIDATADTVGLNADPNADLGQTVATYPGTTESVATRVWTAWPWPTSTTAALLLVNDSGTDPSTQIHFSGGWDRTNMSTQDAVTFIGQGHPSGAAIDFNQKSHVKISKHAFCVVGAACRLRTSYNVLEDVSFFSVDTGVSTSASSNANSCTLTRVVAVGSAATLFELQGLGAHTLVDCEAYDCRSGGTGGVTLTTSENVMRGLKSQNNLGYGLNINGPMNRLKDAVLQYNSVADILLSAAAGKAGFAYNTQLLSTTEVSVAAGGDCAFASHNHDGVAGQHIYWGDGYRVEAEAGADRHTASGLAWKMYVTSTSRTSYNPADFLIARIAVASGSLVTITAWVMRSNTGLSASLVIPASVNNAILGVAADVATAMTASAGTYEQLTATFTPSAAGVVEAYLYAWGGSTYNVVVDDVAVTQ